MIQTLLLSPIGAHAIHGIIAYFHARGARVIGIDSNPEAIGRHFVDAFHVVPKIQDPCYVGAILNVIRQELVDMFVSWLDPEILFWNDFGRGELPAEMARVHTFNLRPDLRRFCDKLTCASMLSCYGFLVPDTRRFDVGWMHDLAFPWILKPRMSSGARNVVRIDDLESWKFQQIRMRYDGTGEGQWIAQQFLSGPEFTVDFFADHGRLVNVVVRERLEHQGVSLRGEVVWAPAILEIVERLVSCFKIDGLNNVQFIASGGNCYITDFNPRPSGTIMLSIQAGVDLFQNLIERHEGKPLTEYGEARGVKMVRYLAEHYYV